MKRRLLLPCAAVALFVTNAAYAAPGVTWEITSQTEGPGIPAGMGDMTTTVCMAKGAEKDPNQLVKQAGNCKLTDLKTLGAKTTWKMTCDNDGELMTGKGEVTHKGSSFQGVTKLNGMVDGKTVNITANYKGKKIGTPCDTSDAPATTVKGMENMNEMMGMANKHMASAMAEQCEVSKYRPAELISNLFFGPKAACIDNQKFACKVISKNVAKKPEVFLKLAKHDDTSDTNIAKACGIDMEAATKAICAMVDGSNYKELGEYCPNEAKAFEEEKTAPTKSGGDSSGSTTNTVIDGAKKLKGLFGW